MIDTKSYSEMPWNNKVALLLKLSGTSTQDASKILGADRKSVDILLGAEDLAFNRGIPLHERTDRLLSVLAYALRLSEYEAKIMPNIVREKNLFTQSLDPPPWDRVGLQDYLFREEYRGIYTCLRWIRTH